ncbi:methyltransferase domain-containing protein [Sarocladium implicatum]|nr:methyltransferase domain-containing protein [Sarocladium implicatum]
MAHLLTPRYPPPDSSLARRQRMALNPIIEEESDDAGLSRSPRRTKQPPSGLHIEAWRSPMSDHFPTPRGVHYLAAPILPASPSTETNSDNSPTSSSNQWNRVSTASANTEFEDIYDVSDDDTDLPKGVPPNAAVTGRLSQKQPSRLVIPINPTGYDEARSAKELKMLASPVPLTPSAQLTMSPAQMTFMDQQQALDIPTISAPPSLDGSLSSEQLAAMSAPPTPVIGNDDDGNPTNEVWAGVELQPGALATLQALSGHDGDDPEHQPEQVLEVEHPQPVAEMRQQPLRLVTSFQARGATLPASFSPASNRLSLNSLTRLDIPSPGGFFSGLSPRSRHTWHMPSKSPSELVPPTSTTAEQFYKCPWNQSPSVPPIPKVVDALENFYRGMGTADAPVERIIEVPDSDDSDDMPTARPILPKDPSTPKDSGKAMAESPPSPDVEIAATEIVTDVDPTYARKQQAEALSHLDRTEMWLVAQRVYLKGVDSQADVVFGLQVVEEGSEEDEEEGKQPEPVPVPKQIPMTRKKTVRFSDISLSSDRMPIARGAPVRIPSKLKRQESAYYRAFQDFVIRNHAQDAFVHQLPRFEALQAQRVSLPEKHRNQLLGKYQLSVLPQSAKKRLSANVARGDHVLVDDPEKLRREKEFEAMAQTTVATWQVAAIKLLNGGRLISAPVATRLARLSYTAPVKKGGVRDRARILDLGGQTTCDWAWHCALQFPNTKIYTVTTKAIRQLSNANIRGPPNHRQVAVERLTRLPFEDNQFDLISARELHSILKYTGEHGEDEWESCMKECMRILKPGGYLEFSILDSDIMNAGPLGLAKSVEFGFSLKTLGYDPSPSKLWLGRLSRAGFVNVRRSWTCLPMGPKQNPFRAPTPPMKDGPQGEAGKTLQMEAMVMGSSNNIAAACSVVGCWSWERWILRCEMEKVAGELRLADTVTSGKAMEEAAKALEGVHAVIEEGRNCNSGFRMLNGHAQKPAKGSEVIKIRLAD